MKASCIESVPALLLLCALHNYGDFSNIRTHRRACRLVVALARTFSRRKDDLGRNAPWCCTSECPVVVLCLDSGLEQVNVTVQVREYHNHNVVRHAAVHVAITYPVAPPPILAPPPELPPPLYTVVSVDAVPLEVPLSQRPAVAEMMTAAAHEASECQYMARKGKTLVRRARLLEFVMRVPASVLAPKLSAAFATTWSPDPLSPTHCFAYLLDQHMDCGAGSYLV